MSKINVKELVDFACYYDYSSDLFYMIRSLDSIPEEDLTPAMRNIKKSAARCLKEYRDSLPETYEKDYNSIVRSSDDIVFLPNGACINSSDRNIIKIHPFVPKNKKALEEYELANADKKTVMEKRMEETRTAVEKESKRIKRNENSLCFRIADVRKYAPVVAYQLEEFLGKKHKNIPTGSSLMELIKARKKAMSEMNIPPEPKWENGVKYSDFMSERGTWNKTYGNIINLANAPINKWFLACMKKKAFCFVNTDDKDFYFWAIHPDKIVEAYHYIEKNVEKCKSMRGRIYMEFIMSSTKEIYGTNFVVSLNPGKKMTEPWILDLMTKMNMIKEDVTAK